MCAQTPSSTDSSPKLTRPVYQYTLPPDKLARSAALRTTRIRVWIVDSIYALALLLLFLYGRWSARFRDVAERRSTRLFLQAWIFVPLFMVTLSVLNLPTAIYSHHLSLSYGLSVQGWPSWFGDWGKGVALEIVGSTLILWLMYKLIRWSPRWCWLYFWAAAQVIMAFVVFIAPVVLDPMFNKFVPLQQINPELVRKIEQLEQRAGVAIPPTRMFEMKASAKSTELNAYVTGWGATKRVVVWDTTEQKMTVPQTLFVVGHEMGHYVLGHVWKGMLFFAGLTLPIFYVGYRLSLWAIRVRGSRWDVRGLGDWASLPVLLLVIGILSFLANPAANAFSRLIEHHADIYGLEVIHGLLLPDSDQAAAQAFQVLGENSLSYPYPNRFLVWWLVDHPPIADRVPFAANYDAWSPGHSPQFVK
ncbi:MAG: M48 family metallopeptidase [Terriglobales bacterium]